VVRVAAEELGEGRVPLSLLKNHRRLQEGVQCLSTKLDDLPSDLALFTRVVLKIIYVVVELPQQSYMNIFVWKPGELFVPTSQLELLQELIIVYVGQLGVPLQKDVPYTNVLLIYVPSHF